VTEQQLNARRNVRRNTADDTDAAQTEGGVELRDSVFKEILYFEYEKLKPMLCR
jgi:hypothetical protein